MAQSRLDFGLNKTSYCNWDDLIHQKSSTAKWRVYYCCYQSLERTVGRPPQPRAEPPAAALRRGVLPRRRGSRLDIWPQTCMPNKCRVLRERFITARQFVLISGLKQQSLSAER